MPNPIVGGVREALPNPVAHDKWDFQLVALHAEDLPIHKGKDPETLGEIEKSLKFEE